MAAKISKHDIDFEFTRVSSHSSPDDLRGEIQSAIDKASGQYDGILLGYGLCGNSTANLMSRSVPLIIPRAHDCCTVFLGSRSSFVQHFGMTPSAEWMTACHYECSAEVKPSFGGSIFSEDFDCDFRKLVEKYGEDNAEYIRQNLTGVANIDFLTYINLPGIENDNARNLFLEQAEKSRKNPLFIDGSLRLIVKLLAVEINDEEFLVVPPGSIIKPVYDHVEIMRAAVDEAG